MASVAALYPNSDVPSSAKQRRFTYDELLAIVKFSGAPQSVRLGTLNALTARGPWPGEDGPATGIICVSLAGMMLGNLEGSGNVVRSTARWRARRAVKLGYWRQVRDANSWSNCPQCGAERKSGACDKCDHVGRAKTPDGKANFDEFCRPYMYEIDIEAFHSAPRPQGIRDYSARTYADHKRANVTDISARKPAQRSPEPPPPPAPADPVRQAAAEHAHRNPVHAASSARKLTPREGPKLVNEMRRLMKGYKGSQNGPSGMYFVGPDHPQYREPMSQDNALIAACMNLAIPLESAEDFLKRLPRGNLGESPP
jgi:hypothetical protein